MSVVRVGDVGAVSGQQKINVMDTGIRDVKCVICRLLWNDSIAE